MIEDHETQKNRRGRKPKAESSATELSQKLVARKRTPESSWPSLRAFAAELGTSHQMLTYYLSGVDKWQAEERAKHIPARAKAAGRHMTLRECLDAIITPGFFCKIEKLRQAAKRGPLNHWQIKMLKLLAKQGFAGAQDLLEKCSQRKVTPEELRVLREKRIQGYREDFKHAWARCLASPHPPSESRTKAGRYLRWRASPEEH